MACVSDRFLAEAAKYPGLDVAKAAKEWNLDPRQDAVAFITRYAAEHGLKQGKAPPKDEETKKAETPKPPSRKAGK